MAVVLGDIRTVRGKLNQTKLNDAAAFERALRQTAEAQVAALQANVANLTLQLEYAVPGTYVLQSDFVTSADTMQNVPGLSFNTEANQRWKVEVRGRYRTANSGTGAGLSLSAPSGAVVQGSAALRQAMNGTDAFFQAQILASGENYASPSVEAADTDYVCLLDCVVLNSGAQGVVQILWRSGVSGSNATLREGTFLVVTKLG